MVEMLDLGISRFNPPAEKFMGAALRTAPAPGVMQERTAGASHQPESKALTIAQGNCRTGAEREKKDTSARDFAAVTKKRTDLQVLDAAVLRDSIERIYICIYEKDKQANTQKVKSSITSPARLTLHRPQSRKPGWSPVCCSLQRFL